MNDVLVRVPATTANLGPGFDCLGVALRMYNLVKVRRGPASADAVIAAASAAFFKKTKKRPFGVELEIRGDVPRSRGLGSSVTVRLGLLMGLNALQGNLLSRDALFDLCAELEGHPDNAAPAVFGGFTIARANAAVQQHRVGRDLKFALLVPDFSVPTARARKVLPKMVALEAAAKSLGNASAIAGAFASRQYEKLDASFEDFLHQPKRAKLVPCLNQVLEAGRAAGALGGWLSGSGSTMVCVSLGSADRIAAAMKRASGLKNAGSYVLQADNVGARVLTES